VLLLHLSRHVNYLQGSAHFILTHLEADPTIVSPHMEPKELSMLQSSLGAASVASQQLMGEINKIKSKISQVNRTLACLVAGETLLNLTSVGPPCFCYSM